MVFLSIYKKAPTFIFFILFGFCAFSQAADTTKRIVTFNVSISITNNGFSLIPAFSLGDPAAIVVLYAGGKRLSFEPEFRYSLDGRPWSFIFIWRYKAIKKEKFQLSFGTHFPALNFVSNAAIINGVEHDAIRARRFFPVIELFPNYYIKKDISVGMYYQYAYGIEKDLAKHTHFVSLRANFSNIPIQGKYYLRFNPQFYYLRMDKKLDSIQLLAFRWPEKISRSPFQLL